MPTLMVGLGLGAVSAPLEECGIHIWCVEFHSKLCLNVCRNYWGLKSNFISVLLIPFLIERQLLVVLRNHLGWLIVHPIIMSSLLIAIATIWNMWTFNNFKFPNYNSEVLQTHTMGSVFFFNNKFCHFFVS